VPDCRPGPGVALWYVRRCYGRMIRADPSSSPLWVAVVRDAIGCPSGRAWSAGTDEARRAQELTMEFSA